MNGYVTDGSSCKKIRVDKSFDKASMDSLHIANVTNWKQNQGTPETTSNETREGTEDPSKCITINGTSNSSLLSISRKNDSFVQFTGERVRIANVESNHSKGTTPSVIVEPKNKNPMKLMYASHFIFSLVINRFFRLRVILNHICYQVIVKFKSYE